MKRIHILGVALTTVFAVSVVVASAASAVEFLLALWLANGSPVTTILLVETEGEVEVISLNTGGFGITTKVLCSVLLDGWIGPESLDFVSELLTLAGVLVPTTVLTGTPLLCTNTQNCTEPEVWADVPFESEAELMIDEGVTFFVDLLLNAGWYVQCLILGITASELCELQLIDQLTNEANGTIDVALSETFQLLAGGKLGNCTVGGVETLEVNGLETMLDPDGTPISVSSE
jgi:hypothetical protein